MTGDPNAPAFRVPSIGLNDRNQEEQLVARVGLQKRFDTLRRSLDGSGTMEAMDRFEGRR